jgi:putative tryptophan/tyrosine transport system substrate-binding protein
VGDARPHVRRVGARRRAIAGLVLLAVAIGVAPPRAPSAQPDPRIPWIGYLANEPTTDSAPILRDGLREHEWIEGQSIKIWYRYAQGKPELYPQHADDLVRLKVAVIVAVGPGAVEAARRATKTIPIVAVSPEDLALGDADANLAGITTFAPELAARRLDLLQEVVPGLARAAVLWRAAGASAAADLRATQAAGSARRVQLKPVEIAADNDIREALAELGKLKPQGLIVLADPVTYAQRQRLTTFVNRAKLPTVYPSREYVDAGGLLGYGANWADVFRQAAALVDQILRGAKPAALGVRRAQRLELVINLRVARAMPVTIPSALLQRADRVVE